MGKAESIIVGLFLSITCPLLTFVLFWWTTALIHLHVPGVPLNAVIGTAFTGLAVGLLLDVAFLRRWVRQFYTARIWLVVAVYLGLSIVAVAFFMGLPLGTFLLGVAFGVYAGRRHRHVQNDSSSVARVLCRAAFLAASITTAAALPIGILVLDEGSVLTVLEAISGFDQASLRGAVGFALVGFLCLILFLLQYYCSKLAGLLAFRIGPNYAQPHAPVDG